MYPPWIREDCYKSISATAPKISLCKTILIETLIYSQILEGLVEVMKLTAGRGMCLVFWALVV